MNSRFYNPQVGRFINGDDMLKSGDIMGTNIFTYTLNNFINKIDVYGTWAGDLFTSIDDAARDFGLCYNQQSIYDNREYTTTIYKVKSVLKWEFSHYIVEEYVKFKIKIPVYKPKIVTYYSYVEPNIVGETGVFSPMQPKGKQRSGRAHTHSAYMEEIGIENDMFSEMDIVSANNAKVPNYVITPAGTMRKYDPKTKEDILLYDDMPYDPNDPYRGCIYY